MRIPLFILALLASVFILSCAKTPTDPVDEDPLPRETVKGTIELLEDYYSNANSTEYPNLLGSNNFTFYFSAYDQNRGLPATYDYGTDVSITTALFDNPGIGAEKIELILSIPDFDEPAEGINSFRVEHIPYEITITVPAGNTTYHARHTCTLLLSRSFGKWYIIKWWDEVAGSGCTWGQIKALNYAFYPNSSDNMWQYQESGNDNDTNTWQLDNNDFTTSGQTMYIHDDAAGDGDYLAMHVEENNSDSMEIMALFLYENHYLCDYDVFGDTPWVWLRWDDYGLDVGDTWDSFNVSGCNKDFWGYSEANCDTVSFDLDAEVKETLTYLYKGTDLTAYLIEHTGKVTFEVDGVDPEDWDQYNYQQDFVFVPMLGFVKMVSYTEQYGNLIPDVTEDLMDTNVTLP